MITVALVGNPNSGKSTLFNALCGANARTGNRAGVTVEVQTAPLSVDKSIVVADLPGTYSLTPWTDEEKVTAAFLREHADAVINTVDAGNVRRNLFLTSQLKDTALPVVCALTMCDGNDAPDLDKLKASFGFDFVETNALTGKGLKQLTEKITLLPKRRPNVGNIQKTTAPQERYKSVDAALPQKPTRKPELGKLDKILLGKLAYPILLVVMMGVFLLCVGGVGGQIAFWIKNTAAVFLKQQTSQLFKLLNVGETVTSFFVDGVETGVLSALSFVPLVMLLYAAITFLEDSGYMARISFLCDKPLSAVGLSGASAICLLLASGCAVSAVTSARVIKGKREKSAICALAPFVPCSAKSAVTVFFCSAVFAGRFTSVIAFYAAALAAVMLGGALFSVTMKSDISDLFLLEMPPYRAPSAKNILRQTLQKGKDFVKKAATVILAASVATWLASNFDFAFRRVEIENSILCSLGKALAFVFKPLGFGNWKLAAATLCGLSAKETVITTLDVLAFDVSSMPVAECLSFVCFNLFCIPCVATVSATANVLGAKKAALTAAFQFVFAYALCFVIYNTAKIFGSSLTPAVVSAVLCLALLCAQRLFGQRKSRLTSAEKGKSVLRSFVSDVPKRR